eukprot:TRINITY_DN27170_c0_g1_i2.p1 TRINITY_DN27170_c0_g1~~TRINITY_DN27170_c0_g1_i2.p1  ORF type:complete len:216 (-),score=13.54 TRINITY_DN27170_c0_g1_i2:166-813(-)
MCIRDRMKVMLLKVDLQDIQKYVKLNFHKNILNLSLFLLICVIIFTQENISIFKCFCIIVQQEVQKMNAILNRKSIRKFKDVKVSDKIVEELLRAAMQAPSAGNEQPWEFIVLRNKEIMTKITEVHPYSKMLLNTDVAIIVCGDQSKEKFKGYWVQDCSAATENILLAAEEKGLGAVWLGVHPIDDRITGLKKLLDLPDGVIPLSIILKLSLIHI